MNELEDMSLSLQQEANESDVSSERVVLENVRESTIQEITNEYVSRMEVLKKEMKEHCERINEENKKKWEGMKQEHKKSLLELTESIKKDSEQGTELVVELQEQMKQYANNLQLLHENYRRQLKQLQEENEQLRTENANAKQEQQKLEYQLELNQIKQLNDEALERHLRINNLRAVIDNFRNILYSVYDVKTSLKRIKINCFYSRVDGFEVAPGELDADFAIIRGGLAAFRLHVENYKKFVANTNYTTTQFSGTCFTLIEEMTSKMDSENFIIICDRFPRIIESGTQESIRTFDNILNGTSESFDELVLSVDRGIEKLVSDHIFSFTNILSDNRSGIPQVCDNNEVE